jgi:hypothetical protein
MPSNLPNPVHRARVTSKHKDIQIEHKPVALTVAGSSQLAVDLKSSRSANPEFAVYRAPRNRRIKKKPNTAILRCIPYLMPSADPHYLADLRPPVTSQPRTDAADCELGTVADVLD